MSRRAPVECCMQVLRSCMRIFPFVATFLKLYRWKGFASELWIQHRSSNPNWIWLLPLEIVYDFKCVTFPTIHDLKITRGTKYKLIQNWEFISNSLFYFFVCSECLIDGCKKYDTKNIGMKKDSPFIYCPFSSCLNVIAEKKIWPSKALY